MNPDSQGSDHSTQLRIARSSVLKWLKAGIPPLSPGILNIFPHSSAHVSSFHEILRFRYLLALADLFQEHAANCLPEEVAQQGNKTPGSEGLNDCEQADILNHDQLVCFVDHDQEYSFHLRASCNSPFQDLCCLFKGDLVSCSGSSDPMSGLHVVWRGHSKEKLDELLVLEAPSSP